MSDSMPYRTEKLPDEPIIIVTISQSYDVERDLPHSMKMHRALLGTQAEPVFYIVDITARPANANDIWRSANMVTSEPDGLYHHPMIREVLYVTQQAIVELGVEGLTDEMFGGVRARAFHTLADALAYARQSSSD